MTDPQKDTSAAAPIDPDTTQLDTSKMVSPNEDSSKEPTPIGDELATKYNGEDDEDEEPTEGIPFAARSHEADVKRALDRTTDDGKGDDEVPESDWQGYATDDVEAKD